MKNEHWNSMYLLAKQYYEENGSLIISDSSNDHLELRKWLISQRRSYKLQRLVKEKIDLLSNIGMIWSLFDLQWQEYYDLATEYFKEKGNLLIPLRFKTKNNKQLGRWISSQRQQYKSNKLSEERKQLLEKIGMVWDGRDATWTEMYKIAKLYYEENGDLNIPNTLFYKDASLGSWILTQRYNYFHNSLTKKQIEMLNEIGMEWVSTRSRICS